MATSARCSTTSSVDAVAITAPHHLHCELAVAALQAGKHVLLEKPMALSVAECSRIIAAAETSRRKLMVGQIMHFVWPCLVAREILESRRPRQARHRLELAAENLDGIRTAAAGISIPQRAAAC